VHVVIVLGDQDLVPGPERQAVVDERQPMYFAAARQTASCTFAVSGPSIRCSISRNGFSSSARR